MPKQMNAFETITDQLDIACHGLLKALSRKTHMGLAFSFATTGIFNFLKISRLAEKIPHILEFSDEESSENLREANDQDLCYETLINLKALIDQLPANRAPHIREFMKIGKYLDPMYNSKIYGITPRQKLEFCRTSASLFFEHCPLQRLD